MSFEPTMDTPNFEHAEKGIARFPPNIEQITIEHDPTITWLVARRNDIELRFPLKPADCAYLAALLGRRDEHS